MTQTQDKGSKRQGRANLTDEANTRTKAKTRNNIKDRDKTRDIERDKGAQTSASRAKITTKLEQMVFGQK
jgi:hypothetical protein